MSDRSGDLVITRSGDELIVTEGGATSRMFAAVVGDVTWIFHEGVTYRLDRSASSRRAAQTHGSLTSPMPATVVSIGVAPGDEVKAGQTLIVLEAMKMELPIRAPGDGRIKAVCCAAGDLVQPDVSLLEFE